LAALWVASELVEETVRISGCFDPIDSRTRLTLHCTPIREMWDDSRCRMKRGRPAEHYLPRLAAPGPHAEGPAFASLLRNKTDVIRIARANRHPCAVLINIEDSPTMPLIAMNVMPVRLSWQCVKAVRLRTGTLNAQLRD
jgi:hypothetical protein